MGAKARIKFARRREGITDYKKRFNMLKAGTPRLVVRQTNTKIIAQVVAFTDSGDKVDVSVLSCDLAGFGWNHSLKSVPAAYLTGVLVGARAKGKNIKQCVLDVGLKTLTKGSRIFAVLKGAIDGGLQIPHSPENFPTAERISGKHIANYRKVDISKDFEAVKAKVAAATAVPAKKEKVPKQKSSAAQEKKKEPAKK